MGKLSEFGSNLDPVAGPDRRNNNNINNNNDNNNNNNNKNNKNNKNSAEKEYVRIALVGQPNAGKSTCMKRILGRQRAIVKDMPGTTRDSIRELQPYKGVQLELVDTAGAPPKAKITCKNHLNF